MVQRRPYVHQKVKETESIEAKAEGKILCA